MTHPMIHSLCIVVLLGVMVGTAPAGILIDGDRNTFSEMLNAAVAPNSHGETFGTFGDSEELMVELQPTQAKYPDPLLVTTTKMADLISEAGIASNADVRARSEFVSAKSGANPSFVGRSMNELGGMSGLTTTIPFNASPTRTARKFLTLSVSGE